MVNGAKRSWAARERFTALLVGHRARDAELVSICRGVLGDDAASDDARKLALRLLLVLAQPVRAADRVALASDRPPGKGRSDPDP
jgi:hypothetical protein